MIDEPGECAKLYQNMSIAVRTEALLLLPDSMALIRAQKLGIIDNLIDASTKRGASIKILCPLDASNKVIADAVQKACPTAEIADSSDLSIDSTFFIVDSAEFIRVEMRNPDAQDFESSIGLAVYSNSLPSVKSFRALFQVVWNQTSIRKEYTLREKLKDEFIAVASHELRTPIQPLLGYAILAKTGKMSQEAAWNGVLTEARRLQRLANNILDVSKIDSSNIRYNLEGDKINMLLVSIADSVRSELKEGVSINVVFDQSETDLVVEIDRMRITQALTNLVNNAIKFTQKGSIKIESKAILGENKIDIRISDTGKGLSEEIIPLLFEKFATKGHGDVLNNKGTGLGLYITRAIIIAHRGKISGFNNSDGGATFLITLPIIQKDKKD